LITYPKPSGRQILLSRCSPSDFQRVNLTRIVDVFEDAAGAAAHRQLFCRTINISTALKLSNYSNNQQTITLGNLLSINVSVSGLASTTLRLSGTCLASPSSRP
jgi:hypothetical protein